MALSANAPQTMARQVTTDRKIYPVGAAEHIYQNGLLGIDPAGHAKPFEPGDRFLGVAYEEADNSAGAAAAINVLVYVEGDFVMPLTGALAVNTGDEVFATSDNTLHTTGHPDAFAGHVLEIGDAGTNYCIVRLKKFGEQPVVGLHCNEVVYDFERSFTPMGAAGDSTVVINDGIIMCSLVGSGVTKRVGGGATLAFDAINEQAQASVETDESFQGDKGLTFEAELNLENIGDNAALDGVWGLVKGWSANSRLDADHGDVTDLALFAMNGNSANIMAESDNNTTDTGQIDTTIDNVTDAGSWKKFKIIVRTTGVVEFWIDKARVLSTTSFAVRGTQDFSGVVNIEKSPNDTAATLTLRRMRVAGVGLLVA